MPIHSLTFTLGDKTVIATTEGEDVSQLLGAGVARGDVVSAPRLTGVQMTKLFDFLNDEKTTVRQVVGTPAKVATIVHRANRGLVVKELRIKGERKIEGKSDEFGGGIESDAGLLQDEEDAVVIKDALTTNDIIPSETETYIPLLTQGQRKRLYAFLDDYSVTVGPTRSLAVEGGSAGASGGLPGSNNGVGGGGAGSSTPQDIPTTVTPGGEPPPPNEEEPEAPDPYGVNLYWWQWDASQLPIVPSYIKTVTVYCATDDLGDAEGQEFYLGVWDVFDAEVDKRPLGTSLNTQVAYSKATLTFEFPYFLLPGTRAIRFLPVKEYNEIWPEKPYIPLRLRGKTDYPSYEVNTYIHNYPENDHSRRKILGALEVVQSNDPNDDTGEGGQSWEVLDPYRPTFVPPDDPPLLSRQDQLQLVIETSDYTVSLFNDFCPSSLTTAAEGIPEFHWGDGKVTLGTVETAYSHTYETYAETRRITIVSANGRGLLWWPHLSAYVADITEIRIEGLCPISAYKGGNFTKCTKLRYIDLDKLFTCPTFAYVKKLVFPSFEGCKLRDTPVPTSAMFAPLKSVEEIHCNYSFYKTRFGSSYLMDLFTPILKSLKYVYAEGMFAYSNISEVSCWDSILKVRGSFDSMFYGSALSSAGCLESNIVYRGEKYQQECVEIQVPPSSDHPQGYTDLDCHDLLDEKGHPVPYDPPQYGEFWRSRRASVVAMLRNTPYAASRCISLNRELQQELKEVHEREKELGKETYTSWEQLSRTYDDIASLIECRLSKNFKDDEE